MDLFSGLCSLCKGPHGVRTGPFEYLRHRASRHMLEVDVEVLVYVVLAARLMEEISQVEIAREGNVMEF